MMKRAATCRICGATGHNRSKCPLFYDLALRISVRRHIVVLDAEMKTPSSHERGSRIGKLINALELALDSAELLGRAMIPSALTSAKNRKFVEEHR
jgi:hypothetical protein